MSDNLQHIDVDSDEFSEAPKALRDHVKKLQAQNSELSTELDGVRTQLSERVIGDVLADKGFKNPTRVRKDMLADQIDPHDESAVTDWLEANADDYARTDSAPPADDPDNDKAAAYQSLNVGEVRAPSSLDALEKAKAEITPDMSPEQVRQVLLKAGC